MPYTQTGDLYYHTYKFRQWYGRPPSPSSMLMSDYFFRLKTSPEMTSPIRVQLTDKALAKEYVCARVGNEYTVPTIAVLHTYKDALRFQYPTRCIIKPTHGSGQIVLRTKGEPINFEQIEFYFDWNYYYVHREANYRPLKPKLIVEPLLFDREVVDDYKFFCWNGEPKFIQVDVDRFTKHTRAFYDPNWHPLPFVMNYPAPDCDLPRPVSLDLMLELARKLSAAFSFIRVDFYARGEQVRVGELTNCPEAGEFAFRPRDAEQLASGLLFT